ncbi:TetR/AcrR family transcriptional regulator [Sphingomonas phyllosphaerae]|uniref:TetR/AcrR family transcriptional regulator n=1 Tax=Sphingomonas phyllosphaerae TaxID=257003 RepID=UPI000400028D|nr:TetR family transcriptional regulator [Sphingomonas phyllosphaerae]
MTIQAGHQNVIDAYLRVMAEHPYAEVTMAMVADAAGLTLGDLRRTFASEEAILEEFASWADAAMLDWVDAAQTSSSARERVIGAMLARFHILTPHRDAVSSILTGAAADAGTLLFFNRVSVEEHRWTLIAAGLNHRGARARNLAEAISQAFVTAAPAWLSDADPDLASTRAAIEASLPYDDLALAAFAMSDR